MKKYFGILVLLLMSVTIFGQSLTLSQETNKYYAESVVSVDNSLTSDVLFTKAKEWVNINYKSSKNVIKYAEDGELILEGNFVTNLFMKEGFIKHTLTLMFKDGKFKYNYTDFVYIGSSGGDLPFESNKMGFKKKIFETTEGYIQSSINSLTKYLKTDNNW